MLYNENIMVLTHNVGTRELRLTCLGANKCNCCKHAVASACTRGSWWSCIMADAHKNDDLAIQTDVVLPEKIKEF